MKDEIEVSPIGELLMYKDGYSPDFVSSTIEKFGLSGLKVNTRSEKLESLDFLADFSFLRSIEVVGIGEFDFSYLKAMPDLQSLSVSIDGHAYIDVRSLSELRKLTILWQRKEVVGLENCRELASLCLVEFSERDLSKISCLGNIQNLEIKTSTIRSVSGIEFLHKLESLLLGNCAKLTSIIGIKPMVGIRKLRFDSCPAIGDFHSVMALSFLEDLAISDCRTVESIGFVRNLPRLQRLSLLGNTDIIDGDIFPAKDVPEVFYKHRSHYNYKIIRPDAQKMVTSNRKRLRDLLNLK